MIAFDFDNTLCINNKKHHKGNKSVVSMINNLNSHGVDVCIVTARMSPELKPDYGINPFYDKIYNGEYSTVDDFVTKHLDFVPIVHYTNGKYKRDKLIDLGAKILVDDNPFERKEADTVGILSMKPSEVSLLNLIIS